MISNDKYPNFDIDLVYIWVDGNDEQWKREKNYWQKKCNVPDSNDTDDSRYVDNEELRYSLRSIAQNAPWINKIFIITNGQIPKWLNTDHPKFQIVNHKEIMPLEALPTFSSCAIETCIANIPNLSEHFLLANDDCFINRPIHPSFFFDKKGRPICRFKKQRFSEELLESSQYIRSINNSINIVNKRYNTTFKNIVPHHNMDAYTKTEYKECIKAFQQEFDKVLFDKFRNDVLQRITVSLYMIAKNKAILKKVSSNCIFRKFDSFYININSYDFMQQQLLKLKPILLCLNDEPNVLYLYRQELKLFLEGIYPKVSTWEIDDNPEIKKIASKKYFKHIRINKKVVLKEHFKDFISSIFSIKNKKTDEKYSKRITILGIKFSIRLADKKTVFKNYSKVLRRLQKQYKKKKIKVIFLIRENQKWTYHSLYKLFEASPYFEPLILLTVLTSVHCGKDNTRDTLEENYKFFKSRGYNVDYLYKDGKPLSLKKFKPDIVFYDQPWELFGQYTPLRVSKYALTCFCSYSFEILNDKDNYFKGFHSLLYKYFIEHELNLQRYITYSEVAEKNCVTTGYPKLDQYFDKKSIDCTKYFKEPEKIKIIYAPHHSFDNSLQLATFMQNGKFILELAKKSPETTWCFKPHPRLKFALLKMNFMSMQEIEEYYKEWSTIGKIYDKGDYIDLFKASDLMITDCLSFLAEYLPSKKPLIRLINPKAKPLNELGEKVVSQYYFSHSNDELRELFNQIAIKSDDYKINNRISLINNIMNTQQTAAENIFNKINSLLERKEFIK